MTWRITSRIVSHRRIVSSMALAFLTLVPGICDARQATKAGPGKPATPAAQTDAQPATKPPQPTPPGWRYRCESAGRGDPLTCMLNESAVLTQTGQVLVDFNVRVPPDRTAVALIQVPAGVFLPGGVEVQIDDGSKLDLPLQTCEQRGCFAGTTLAPAVLDQMRGGKVLKVSFDNLNKQKLTVSLPLNGFGPAFDKIR